MLGLFAVVSPNPYPISGLKHLILIIWSEAAGLGCGGKKAWNFRTMLEESLCEFENSPTVQYHPGLFGIVKIAWRWWQVGTISRWRPIIFATLFLEWQQMELSIWPIFFSFCPTQAIYFSFINNHCWLSIFAS